MTLAKSGFWTVVFSVLILGSVSQIASAQEIDLEKQLNEAALKATRKARRTEDSDAIESAMDAQEEHAAGAFTDASLAHCLPTCSWFSIVGARRPNPCCMHVS